VPGSRVLVRLLLALQWRGGVQNPRAADQGETVTGTVPLCEAGRNVPVSRLDARQDKILEAVSGLKASSPGLGRWCYGVPAGLQADC
jgi:hypothetical protein